MSIPKGVTVRQIGDPLPPGLRPRNRLEAAAMLDDVAEAKAMLCGALALDPESGLARINISEAYRWKRFDPSSRLREIANWLKAECYECMDLVQVDPISTKGD